MHPTSFIDNLPTWARTKFWSKSPTSLTNQLPTLSRNGFWSKSPTSLTDNSPTLARTGFWSKSPTSFTDIYRPWLVRDFGQSLQRASSMIRRPRLVLRDFCQGPPQASSMIHRHGSVRDLKSPTSITDDLLTLARTGFLVKVPHQPHR